MLILLVRLKCMWNLRSTSYVLAFSNPSMGYVSMERGVREKQ